MVYSETRVEGFPNSSKSGPVAAKGWCPAGRGEGHASPKTFQNSTSTAAFW